MKKAIFVSLVLMFNLFVCFSQQIDLKRGLVAYYQFDGDASDASGNERNGVIYGASMTSDRKGVANSAYYFRGIDYGISAKNEFKIQAKVDERIELLSVVCRLAEYEEYVNNNIPDYAKDVDKYFAAYKSHTLISFTKKLKSERGISHDAIASIATNIKIGKEVKLKDDLYPKV